MATKEISLKGLSSTLSDYNCEDGDMQVCHNMVAGKPIIKPVALKVDGEEINYDVFVGTTSSGQEVELQGVTFSELLFQHKTSNGINLIGVGKSTVNGAEKLYLYWYDKSNNGKWRQLSDVGGDGEKTCTQVGNILVVNASDGIHYLIFKNFTYKYLGQSIPELDIDFCMQPAIKTIDSDAIVESGNTTSDTTAKDIRKFGDGRIHRMVDVVSKDSWSNSAFESDTPWEEHRSTIENALFGGCNYIYSETAKQNQFLHPFFVRYAIKMYDGTYTMHSAPIMMTPSDSDKIQVSIINCYGMSESRKIVEKVDDYTTPSDDSKQINNTYLYGIFRYSPSNLLMKVKNVDKLEDWRDLIQDVSIFVSPQITSYTATGKCDIGLYPSKGATDEGKNITKYDVTYFNKSADGDIEYATSNYQISAVTGNYVDLEIGNGVGLDDNNVVEEQSYNVAKVTMPTREGTQRDWIEEAANNFRLVRSYTLEELKDIQADIQNQTNESHKWWWVKGEGSEGLKNLNTSEQLIDGYAPRRLYKPSVMHVYNSRLHMANCYIKERDNFLKNILGNRAIPDASAFGNSNKDVKVYIEEDGVWQVVSTTMKELCMSGYISYPNPNAKWIYVKGPQDLSDEESPDTYFKLKPHPYLFSAYHWSGDYLKRGSGITDISLTDIPSTFGGEFNKHNYIYTTSVDNPFVVEAQGVNAIGNGDIISMQNATEAMSEGTAFGAQPLSVFTTDGIYALQVNAVGLYDRAAPISRETIKKASDVLAIDNSVIFLSGRGLMELRGSRTLILSQALTESHRNIEWSTPTLPHFNDINTAGDYNSEWSDSFFFMQYIKDAHLAFDYENYRIYIYKPSCLHAYVYDLSTKLWSTCENIISSSIVGYPSTILTCNDGNNNYAAEFSNSSSDLLDSGNVFYVTRPMKFNEHDILKTVRDIHQRGSFHNHGEEMKLALWASRDMTHWQYIGGVKKGCHIPRLSGTPWKYYIVGGWAKLSANGDNISRLTVQIQERYTNKIR